MTNALLIAVVLCGLPAAKRMNEAVEAYRGGRFTRAVELFNEVIVSLQPNERGTALERDAREKLVLSLYAAKKPDAALSEYKELVKRFPDFAFDPDRVSPETVKFFADATPKKAQEKPIVVAPASTPAAASEKVTEQPRVVVAPAPPVVAKRWHWYYLAPLGIGQFLAGSPVRGTIFAVLQVGLIALNAVSYALLMKEIRSDGTVESLNRAYPLQVLTNVGFFGWIGALTAGTIDGFLEP